ncbi:MAG: hypothetical protein ACFFD4_38115 [Candidatus Odinarchaeota archaeon]
MKTFITENKLVLSCIILGLVFAFIRMFIEGVGFGSDGYDIYADYIKNVFRNTVTPEEEAWFANYRWNNRLVYPLILAILSLITSLNVLALTIPVGILSYVCSNIALLKILEDRGNTKQEIQIIVSVFSLCPALVSNITRLVTDCLFLFLTLSTILYFQRYTKDGSYKDFFLGCFFIFLAALTREIGFLLLASIVLLLVFRGIYLEKYFLTGFTVVTSILGVLFFLIIFDFDPLSVVRLFFGGETTNLITEGNFSLADLVCLPFRGQSLYRTITILESLVYTVLIAGTISLVGLLEYDRKELIEKIKTSNDLLTWIWFTVLSSYLLFIYPSRMQARYWLPISFVVYLGIHRGILFINKKTNGRISKNWILLAIILCQAFITIVRLILLFYSISLLDLLPDLFRPV